MKAHKYWSVGALITMIGTFYTGHKGLKSSHKYFALSSMLCMTMAIYTGHKMISGRISSVLCSVLLLRHSDCLASDVRPLHRQ